MKKCRLPGQNWHLKNAQNWHLKNAHFEPFQPYLIHIAPLKAHNNNIKSE